MPKKRSLHGHREWRNQWKLDSEKMAERWGSETDFPWERVENLMNTQPPNRDYHLTIEKEKQQPYIRGTYSTVWEHMDPGDSFLVPDEPQRKAAIVAAKRNGMIATSEKEGDKWRVWLVSNKTLPVSKVDKSKDPERAHLPITKAKEFTMGSGPAKYVYASDMAMLERQLQVTQLKLARGVNEKLRECSESRERALEFIDSVGKHSKDEKTKKAANIWLLTNEPNSKYAERLQPKIPV